MSEHYPLISCICITSNRPVLLKRAISCFKTQNYPNTELVISYPQTDRATRELLDQLDDDTIQLLRIERHPEESLGNARNQAIAKCHGAYVCIWDDDDWHHSSRLFFQYNSIQDKSLGYHASILTRILLYDVTTKATYLSFPYTWDGTILCKKEYLLQNQYANQQKAEDTHVIRFLSARKLLLHVTDVPFLYIYVYHGENTWNYEHFKYFTEKSEVLAEDVRNQVLALLEVPG